MENNWPEKSPRRLPQPTAQVSHLQRVVAFKPPVTFQVGNQRGGQRRVPYGIP